MLLSEKTKKPLVSVLIPLYNSEKYLSETIDSLLAQTYKNTEIIIIDDGSTDYSPAIAREYEKSYKQIKVYNQKNSGAQVARNKAFEMSSGEYIQYFDADDIIHPDKISLQIAALRNYNFKFDIVATGRRGFFLKSTENAKFENQVIYKSYDDNFLFFKEAWLNCECIIGQAWLISRKMHEIVGSWNIGLQKNQDGEFFARVAYNSKKIIYVEDSIVFYRKGVTNSISSDKSPSGARSHLDSLHEYANLVKNDMETHSLHKALATLYVLV